MFPSKKYFRILRKFHFKSGRDEDLPETVYLDSIKDLQKAAIYKGTKFEWVVMDSSVSPYDYELTYHEMSDHTIGIWPENEFEVISRTPDRSECDCGSFTAYGVADNNGAHSHWCKTQKGRRA
jgi:hypothetical protein